MKNMLSLPAVLKRIISFSAREESGQDSNLNSQVLLPKETRNRVLWHSAGFPFSNFGSLSNSFSNIQKVISRHSRRGECPESCQLYSGRHQINKTPLPLACGNLIMERLCFSNEIQRYLTQDAS